MPVATIRAARNRLHMERYLLVAQLRECEQHIARKTEIVAHQRQSVAEMEANHARSLSIAKQLLATFEKMLADSQVERRSLRQQLDEAA